MKEVNDLGQAILDALSTDGGTTTWEVMMRVGPDTPKSWRRSAAEFRAALIELETMGRVRRLDDKAPVCWLRVETA